MKRVKEFANRIVAMLMSGILIVGAVPGTVLASDNRAEIGQTSEMAAEVPEGTTAEEISAEEYSEDAVAQEEAAAQYYTVILDANGGYFENGWDDALQETVDQAEVLTKYIPVGETVSAVPAYKQEKVVAAFLGWSLERDGEIVAPEQEEYAPADSCTLYAVWEYENQAGDLVVNNDNTDETNESDDVVEEAAPEAEMVKDTDPGTIDWTETDGTETDAFADGTAVDAAVDYASEDYVEEETAAEDSFVNEENDVALYDEAFVDNEGPTDAVSEDAGQEETDAPADGTLTDTAADGTSTDAAADDASEEYVEEETAAEDSFVIEEDTVDSYDETSGAEEGSTDVASKDAGQEETAGTLEPVATDASETISTDSPGIKIAETNETIDADAPDEQEEVISEAVSSIDDYPSCVVGFWGGHKYQLFEENVSPVKAQEICRTKGGYLVTITSAEEQAFIGQLANQGDNDTYTTGGTDLGHEGTWEWITGESWEYTSWYPGGSAGTYEPNNGWGKGEDYTCISRTRGWDWVDWYGGYDEYEATNAFICEWDSGDSTLDGHIYKRFDEFKTWTEAENYCKSLGGHLVTITSAGENSGVSDISQSGSKNAYWIGARIDANGETDWVTKEPLSYVNWANKEPDDYQSKQGYAFLFGKDYISSGYYFGQWGDLAENGVSWNNDSFWGSSNFGFICEWDSNSVITLKSSYEGNVNKELTINADIISRDVAPDSSNVIWTLTPSDGQHANITWESMDVVTNGENQYRISRPVTVSSGGEYKLTVSFDGVSNTAVVTINSGFYVKFYKLSALLVDNGAEDETEKKTVVLTADIKSADGDTEAEKEESEKVSWASENQEMLEVIGSEHMGVSQYIKVHAHSPGKTNLIVTFSDGTTRKQEIIIEPKMEISIGARLENGDIDEVLKVHSYKDIWCEVKLASASPDSDYLSQFINGVQFNKEALEKTVNFISEKRGVSGDGKSAFIKLRIGHKGQEDWLQPRIIFTSPCGHTAEKIFELKKDLVESIQYRANGSRWNGGDGHHTFRFVDDYFYKGATTYNNDLAVLSLGIDMASYTSHDFDSEYTSTVSREKNIKEAFAKFGFRDAKYYRYNLPLSTSEDREAFSIGRTVISTENEDDTLIAVVVRGGAYGAGWASNFHVGNQGDHVGFSSAATYIHQELKSYIQKLITEGKIVGDIKLWITGYSRGGAIANLLGHYVMDGSLASYLERDNVYVYTFATPSGQRGDDHSDTNIFNIVSVSDFVPRLALRSGWNFSKYGITKQLVGDFYKTAVNGTFYCLTHDNLHIGDAGKNLSDLMEAFKELIPDTDQYSYMAQNTVMNSFKNNYSDKDDAVMIPLSFIEGMITSPAILTRLSIGQEAFDKYVSAIKEGDNEKATEILVKGIIEKILKKKIEGDVEYEIKKYAPPELRIICTFILGTKFLADNYQMISVLQSHYPEYYLSWLESGGVRTAGPDSFANLTEAERRGIHNSIEKEYDNAIAKGCEIRCPVDVRVYNESGKLVGAIVDDTVTVNEIPCFFDDGTKVVYIPKGGSYTMELTGTDYGTMDYTVKEFSDDWEIIRNVDFVDVKLEPELVYTGTVSGNVLDPEETYTITDGTNIPEPNRDTLRNIDLGEYTTIANGTCGTEATWTLYENGSLYITGKGKMAQYNGDDKQVPWEAYKSDIKKVVIGEGITMLGSCSFCNCENLQDVILPLSLTLIDFKAFNGCTSIKECNIPSNVTEIGSSSFAECSGLRKVTIPNGVETIDNYAFYKCSSLENLDIPNSVNRIGQSAFSNCSALEWAKIPESVSAIDDFVFSNCSSLKNIVIPGNVASIGMQAFSGCSNLQSVTFKGNAPQFESNTDEDCLVFSHDNTIIYYPGKMAGWDEAKAINWKWAEIEWVAINQLVESISMNQNSLELEIGGTGVFSATVSPKDADVKDLIWRSQDPSIAAVDEHGRVAGITAGTTTITATSKQDPSISNTCTVIVRKPSVENTTITGVLDKTYTGDVITQNIVVATTLGTLEPGIDYLVDYKNNINAGTATVIITGKGKYTGTKEQSFTIKKAAQSIKVSDLVLPYAKTGTISASENKGKLTYKSSDESIATVDSKGKVTSKGVGNSKITITAAETDNYKKATKQINVTVRKAAQSITAKAGASSVAVGKTTTVSITGAKGARSFKSSNTAIATITSAGKVTAKKVGTVRITATSAATANYKAASKTVTINVVPVATTSLTASNQVTGIKLFWKKVTGANGYKIYRGKTLIKTITSGSTVTFIDKKANTNGTKYVYKLVAKASTGDSTLSKTRGIFRVARTTISSLKNSSSKKMTVKWYKNAKGNGYQIQYSRSKTFASGNKTATVAGASTVSKVISSLTKGKTYYVRVRTYKTVNKVKYFSSWSASKSVKIRK